MARKPPLKDWYWPLGGLSYASEVDDFFPDEAQTIGVIAIMWNRQEIALRRIFVEILQAKDATYAEAIWERQPTHQARRDLLSLAIHSAELTERQAMILDWIIENTKTIADRRNELMHAEYVVHGRTEVLHAKVKAPRSNKPAKHQKVSLKDLRKVVDDLNHLLAATESAVREFLSLEKRAEYEQLGREIAKHVPSRENQRTD